VRPAGDRDPGGSEYRLVAARGHTTGERVWGEFTSVYYWWEELFAACFAAFDAGSRYPHIASMDFYPKVLRHESTARLGDLPGA